MALIDVLIPTYNPKADQLSEALRCLQAQTFQDFQALVHDDCSPGVDTQKIVESFLSDPRITFKKSEERLGIGGNWNTTAKLTNAPIVAYLFQDDLWHPNYLAEAVKILDANPGVGFVSMEHPYKIEGGMDNAHGYKAVEDFRNQHVKSGLHKGKDLLRWWLEHELTPNIVGEPSFVVMKREAMRKMGPFLEDMPQFLDVEYWTRLLREYDWYFLRGDYGSFRVHPGGASAVNQESGKGLFDRLRCFEILIGTVDDETKSIAARARSRALAGMVAKFRNRVRSGKKVSGQGGGELKRFVLRHPFLIMRALLTSLFSQNSKIQIPNSK